jgi:hypothetical protein
MNEKTLSCERETVKVELFLQKEVCELVARICEKEKRPPSDVINDTLSQKLGELVEEND